ncbi:MAG: hypothetical protein U0325_05440 [Polyangiales bacterium]
MDDGTCAYVAEAFEGGYHFLAADAQRLIQISTSLQDVSDLALRDRALKNTSPRRSNTGKLFLAANAQRLIQFSMRFKMSAIFPCVIARARTSPRRPKTASCSSRRMRSALSVLREPQDVCDLALRDRTHAYVAEALEDGQLFFAADAQRLIQFSASLQDVCDLALRDGTLTHVAEALEDGQFFLATNAGASSRSPRACRISPILPW